MLKKHNLEYLKHIKDHQQPNNKEFKFQSKLRECMSPIKLYCSAASHPVRLLPSLLCFSSVDQPLPELRRDVGDVARAGDG